MFFFASYLTLCLSPVLFLSILSFPSPAISLSAPIPSLLPFTLPPSCPSQNSVSSYHPCNFAMRFHIHSWLDVKTETNPPTVKVSQSEIVRYVFFSKRETLLKDPKLLVITIQILFIFRRNYYSAGCRTAKSEATSIGVIDVNAEENR